MIYWSEIIMKINQIYLCHPWSIKIYGWKKKTELSKQYEFTNTTDVYAAIIQ